MSTILKSALFAAVILFGGIVTVNMVYDKIGSEAIAESFSTLEPAAGDEEVVVYEVNETTVEVTSAENDPLGEAAAEVTEAVNELSADVEAAANEAEIIGEEAIEAAEETIEETISAVDDAVNEAAAIEPAAGDEAAQDADGKLKNELQTIIE